MFFCALDLTKARSQDQRHRALRFAEHLEARIRSHQGRAPAPEDSPHRLAMERIISPTHKRTEGRAPVWGSEFTSKRSRTTGGGPAETAVG